MNAIKALSPTPLVTVMIPTFNQSAYISDAIDSALAQDYGHLEVLVVDDHSSDDTGQVVNSYGHNPRLRYVRNQVNLGRVANYRSSLTQHARGELVLNLDGDDWLADRSYIAEAVRIFQGDPKVAMVYARAGVSEGEAKGTAAMVNPSLCPPTVTDGLAVFMGFADRSVVLPHLTVVYRRDLALETGFYLHDIIGSDALSLLQLMPYHRVGFVDREVAIWRRHASNASGTTDVESLIRDFLVADLPASNAVSGGLMSKETAAKWRRKVGAFSGYRRFSGLLVDRGPLAAGHFLMRMFASRPRATMDAVAELLVKGNRKLTSKLRPK